MKHTIEELGERAAERGEDFYLRHIHPNDQKPGKRWEACSQGGTYPTVSGYGDDADQAVDDMIEKQERQS